MSLLERLQSFDRRIIYVVMLVVISLPLLNPLGSPWRSTKGRATSSTS
jgi:hypothetical protein